MLSGTTPETNVESRRLSRHSRLADRKRRAREPEAAEALLSFSKRPRPGNAEADITQTGTNGTDAGSVGVSGGVDTRGAVWVCLVGMETRGAVWVCLVGVEARGAASPISKQN